MKAMKAQMSGSPEEREARELAKATEDLFKAFDADGSGEISREEMVNGAPLLGMDPQAALKLFGE